MPSNLSSNLQHTYSFPLKSYVNKEKSCINKQRCDWKGQGGLYPSGLLVLRHWGKCIIIKLSFKIATCNEHLHLTVASEPRHKPSPRNSCRLATAIKPWIVPADSKDKGQDFANCFPCPSSSSSATPFYCADPHRAMNSLPVGTSAGFCLGISMGVEAQAVTAFVSTGFCVFPKKFYGNLFRARF